MGESNQAKGDPPTGTATGSSTTRTLTIPRVGLASLRAHALAVLASMVLLYLAFPPVAWWWCAHLALVPMAVLALRSRHVGLLAAVAYLGSLMWWLIVIRWMTPVTVPGYALLSVYLALYVPAGLLGLRLLDRRLRFPAVLGLPMLWVSLELIRGTILAGGFGWFRLGHSQAPHDWVQMAPWLMQCADVLGEAGVTWLVAMTSGAVVDALNRPWVKPSQATPGPLRQWTGRRSVVLWLVVTLAACGYGVMRILEHPARVSLAGRVAVVQTNEPQSNRNNPTRAQLRAAWHQLKDLTREAATAGDKIGEPGPPADLIVWPESAVLASLNPEARDISSRSRQLHQEIQELTQQTGATLLVGAAAATDFQARETPEGTYLYPGSSYNAAFVYHPQGEQDANRYDKVHRVPFGEYTPWIDAVPGLKAWYMEHLNPYDFDYSIQAGQRLTVFEVAAAGRQGSELHVVTPICFEDTVGRVVRRMVYAPDGTKRADAIVNLTNDGWFAGTAQPWQHLQIAVFRSVENRVPTARAVNTGVSGFIDSLGRVGPLVRAEGLSTQVADVAGWDLELDSRRTWFGWWGRLFGWTVLWCTLGLLAVGGLGPAIMRRMNRAGGRADRQA